MAVEFVVAAPAFALLLLLVSGGGQWISASGQVGAAARDAARQASIEVDYNDVQQAALTVAQEDLNGLCPNEANVSVQLLANGQPVSPADFAGAQIVEVQVSCTVNLKVFTAVGFPAHQTFTDVAAAPLDPFSQRTG
jgi:Flp pilus assembly protein TadG